MSATINDITVKEICKIMRKHGFIMYREHFRWGHTPAFRNAEKTQYYFVDRHQIDGEKLAFIIVTPLGMLKHLHDTWRPVRRDDAVYFSLRMDAEMMELPHTPEWPHGELDLPVGGRAKPRFTARQIENHDTGICLSCGEEADGCEPDMRGGKCESCGVRRVFGLEEALFMGEIELDMEE